MRKLFGSFERDMTKLSRRAALAGLVALPLATLPAFAEDLPTHIAPPGNNDVAPKELTVSPPNSDVSLGSDKAPVTIYEYASATCSHCAHFSTTTFPELKKRYIDTGKVRYIFREFPLDPLAALGFMLARCAGPDKFLPVVETLFAKQSQWMVDDPIAALKPIVKPFGVDEQGFVKCISNQKALDSLQASFDYAAKTFAIHATPTFFVNGKRLVGDQSIDDLANVIDPLLPK